MKTKRLHELGFIAGGVLCGFAAGIYTYLAFFLLPGQARNGVAMFIASICALTGAMVMALTRAEVSREEKAKDKHDA